MIQFALIVFAAALGSVSPCTIDDPQGLEISLIPAEPEFELGEPIPFRIRFRNTSDQGFSVNAIPAIGPHGIEILVSMGDEVWVSGSQILDRPREVLSFRNVPLAPGYSLETPVFKMGPSIYAAEVLVPISNSGIYQLQVRYTASETDQPPAVCPLWVGSTTSDPLEILVRPPSADVLHSHIAVLRDVEENRETDKPGVLAALAYFSVVIDPAAAVKLRKILEQSEFSEPILPVLVTAISNQGTQEDFKALGSFLSRPEVPPYIRLLIDGAISNARSDDSDDPES